MYCHIKGLLAKSSDVRLMLGKHREYERNRDKKSIKLITFINKKLILTKTSKYLEN